MILPRLPHPRPRVLTQSEPLCVGALAIHQTGAWNAWHAVSPTHSIGVAVLFLLASLFNTILASAHALESDGKTPPNVLMILIDDLKPTLGCYGDPFAKTPNIDRLAGEGMRFEMAYCNQAICSASRFTLLLGAHSTSTGLYNLGHRLRTRLPDAVTLPQHFASHGYRVEGLGKIFHVGHGNQGDPESFPGYSYKDLVVEYRLPESTHGGKLTREEALFTNQSLDRIPSLPRGAAWESPDVPDEAYADGRVARETVKRLELAKINLEQNAQPFFLMTGFVRPHLPFSAPKKYWDLYERESLPLTEFHSPPKNAPAVAGKRSGEIAAYDPIPTNSAANGEDQPLPEDLQRSLVHGYYASTSYMDAQLGLVLDALARLELTENTVVVLWSDHGYHLGDLGIWTKHTNYEQANRIPLIISAPGTTTPGSSTRQMAQSVDLFPTLCDLTGLPSHSGTQPIDGLSLVPVLRDSSARVRDHVFHAFPRAKLGRAIRTERYRLVEWKHQTDPSQSTDWELYDYQGDSVESENIASLEPEILKELQKILDSYPPAKRP